LRWPLPHAHLKCCMCVSSSIDYLETHIHDTHGQYTHGRAQTHFTTDVPPTSSGDSMSCALFVLPKMLPNKPIVLAQAVKLSTVPKNMSASQEFSTPFLPQKSSSRSFARQFIGFVCVETKQIVSSNPNVISTRQTCGHGSAIARGKCRALAFIFLGRAASGFA